MNMNTSPWIKYLLLWFVGMYLRLGILIVPPLIPTLEIELGFNLGHSALATSLPLLMLSFGAFFGGILISRIGVLKTLIVGMAVMALGSSIRSFPIELTLFMLVTVVMGIGFSLMQIGLPALTRVWLPKNIGRAAAVYTTGLLFGEWIAAGFTNPMITHWLDGAWRLSFTVWMLPIPIIILSLWVFGDRQVVARSEADMPKVPMMPDWKDPLMWRVAVVMSSSGILYFAGNIFLPPILVDTHRVELLDATLSALNGVQIFSSVALIFFADRLVGKVKHFIVLNVLALLTIPGYFLAPDYWIVVVAGVSGAITSAILVLAVALPAWVVPAAQVSRLSAGMLTIGYVIVFSVPVFGGWLNDITGIRALAFLPTLIVAVVAMILVGGIRRRE